MIKIKGDNISEGTAQLFLVIQITMVDILFRSKQLFQHFQITITFQQKLIKKLRGNIIKLPNC